MARVTLDGVSKRYRGAADLAVDRVSLAVEDGEFMVFLGPSGCGKSTTLRMIAGLEAISDGTLAIDDRRMNEVPAKDRDIAMVFQSYALYPHMTVGDNMAFGLRRRGFPRAEIDRRVTDAARLLGLDALLARKPHALSGGQRQRVALGRAIVRDPKVFLFDEPLSNLDAALRVSTRNELIKQHQRLGATMIYVTHDQVEAMTMGSRICIMNGGRVVQVGAPLEVYRRPADTFVARFLGSPPMNLMRTRIEGANGVPVARLGAVGVPLPAFAGSAPAGEALLGIRPEDMYETLPPDLPDDAPAIEARIVAVEPLGAETHLVLALDGVAPEGGGDVIARVGRQTALAAGDRATLRLDPGALHLFDIAAGTAIPPTRGTAA